MPVVFRPNSYANILATDARTERALSVAKLFKAGFEPTPATLVADLDLNEADYSDYAPETITAWLPPATVETGGWSITAPTEQFLCVGDQAVPNMIGGMWFELAAGEVFMIVIFDDPEPMALDGDSIRIAPTEVFGNGV